MNISTDLTMGTPSHEFPLFWLWLTFLHRLKSIVYWHECHVAILILKLSRENNFFYVFVSCFKHFKCHNSTVLPIISVQKSLATQHESRSACCLKFKATSYRKKPLIPHQVVQDSSGNLTIFQLSSSLNISLPYDASSWVMIFEFPPSVACVCIETFIV